MNKKTDLQIINSIRDIVEETECDISYHIDRHTDRKLFGKKNKEIISINIILTKEL